MDLDGSLNRITGFTGYIVRLNSAFSLDHKKEYNKHTVSIPMG